MLKLTFLKFTQKRRAMKVLNREPIREADAYTIENEPIKSIDLMERASERFTKMFRSLFKNNKAVYVFCGVGNNGGDGLVVSRLLAQKKYLVTTVVVHYSEKQSKDFTLNYDRLKSVRILKF
jgi:NAD(P)H-hydrate repair Nnr-like enzyme with NAD(P)H-hydrate epimerase domain